eukprot:TRINITY_DN36553_c0_g1_i1.p1 TRINITY_DN36553_c0_g1~~TRINITY_DN36553_c0_g1_i1.p1  ORF type:complete len:509 (+),score=105.27 TRINITY_DN36553_c0_g1_i1:116-1642(+)
MPPAVAGQQLQEVLRQSTRSAFLRIVNLTRQPLRLDDGAEGRDVRTYINSDSGDTRSSVTTISYSTEDNPACAARGFWIAAPSALIAPGQLHDAGITGQGFMLGVRSTLHYVMEAPHSVEETKVRIKIHFQSPWVGRRRISATDAASFVVVQSACDGKTNLSCVVHILDPRHLPKLEVLTAAPAKALSTSSSSTQGVVDVQKPDEELTRLVRKHCLSDHELRIPSVRALVTTFSASLCHNESRDHRDTSSPRHLSGQLSDCFAGFELVYRIGPEVFKRVFMATESAHLSSAVPAGDANPGVVLSATAYISERKTTTSMSTPSASLFERVGQRLPLMDQCLALQRLLTSTLSPVVCRMLESVLGVKWREDDTMKSVAAHLWPLEGEGGKASILDLEGLLDALRQLWSRLVPSQGDLGANVFVEAPPVDDVLPPLELLCAAWAEQAELDNAALSKAAASACTLFEVFGCREAAEEVEGSFCPKGANGRRRTSAKKSLAAASVEQRSTVVS